MMTFSQKVTARRAGEYALFLFAAGVPRNERSRVLGVHGAFSFGATSSKEKADKR
jgi:hypothetical protein